MAPAEQFKAWKDRRYFSLLNVYEGKVPPAGTLAPTLVAWISIKTLDSDIARVGLRELRRSIGE
jgi:hypothetical protein